MRLAATLSALVIAGVGLAGCSTFDDITGGDDETTVAAAPEVIKDPVVRIETLELGRLYRGYMLSATGIAASTGYYEPELRIRYGGELGPDGFYEFDFVAIAPEEPGATNAPVTARVLRGDYELTPEMLRTARGVRVWSSRDSVEGRF